jgi:hypothetical protein
MRRIASGCKHHLHPDVGRIFLPFRRPRCLELQNRRLGDGNGAEDGVLDALNMALQQRRPNGVIHHSAQGCQYTSIAFGLRCGESWTGYTCIGDYHNSRYACDYILP